VQSLLVVAGAAEELIWRNEYLSGGAGVALVLECYWITTVLLSLRLSDETFFSLF